MPYALTDVEKLTLYVICCDHLAHYQQERDHWLERIVTKLMNQSSNAYQQNVDMLDHHDVTNSAKTLPL